MTEGLKVISSTLFCKQIFTFSKPTIHVAPSFCRGAPYHRMSSGAVMCRFTYWFWYYIFTYLLPYFLKNRPVPFPGWKSSEVTKPGFSFFAFILCYIIFCYGYMFAFVVRFSFSVLSQETVWKERLQNDQFCVRWEGKLNSIN